MTLELMVEGAMCVLLLGCMAYGFILNRHLGHFRVHQAEFRVLFETFSGAIARAQQGVQDLKKAGEEGGAQLSQRIDAAQKLIQEMDYLVGRAESLSQALENNTKQAKQAILEQNRESTDRVRVIKPAPFSSLEEEDQGGVMYSESRRSRKGPFGDSDESFDLLKSIEKLR